MRGLTRMRSTGGSRRLAVALLVAVVTASCGSSSPPSTPAASAVQSAVATPGASAGGCAAAGIPLVTAFIDRLAHELLSLRTLVLADDLDATAVATAMRRMSAALTAFDDLDETLGGCEATAELGASVAALRGRMGGVLGRVLQGSIKDAAVQRQGAVDMLRVLPDLAAFADATGDLARTLGLESLVPADDPLQTLRPLVVALAAPQPAGTTLTEFTAWTDALWPVIDPLATSVRKAGDASDKRTRRTAAAGLRDAVAEAKIWLDTHQPWPCYESSWRAAVDAIAAYETAATAYAAGRVTAGADALEDARSFEAKVKGIAQGAVLAACELEPTTHR